MKFTKGDFKTVGIVGAGVILAGWLMYQFRDVSFIDQSRSGYGG